jgi:GWxTD domain-containing protein
MLFVCPAQAQVFAYFSSCVFNTPAHQSYAETYLTIHGASLFAKEEKGRYRNSVNIEVKFLKDSVIFKANKYNLIGPPFEKGSSAPSFIDNQRYILPNGNYDIELNISDNYSLRKKTLTIKDKISIAFNDGEIQLSSIQALESYTKTDSPGALTKSGFDLLPYIVNYYPETTGQLAFYVEAYNTEKLLGANSPFLFYYYLENTAHVKLDNYVAFKKQKAAQANPLLSKFDISTLPTGNYNLVVEVRDGENQIRSMRSYSFERLNRKLDFAYMHNAAEQQMEAEYFGSVKDADTLKMFVECLWPIADGVDKERIVNQSVKKDPELMKKYVIDFWQRRAADTANPLKMWASYYQSVQQTMALFKCGKQKGYYSDRGRVYLQYGPPSQRTMQPNEPNTYPYEIWQYYRTTDQTNGQFFSNRKFVFVNHMLGDDCYQLIHSDMRGEPNNPRWQFELTRRNNNGLANPDNTTPVGTEFNQFNEIYSNPR